MEVLIGVFSFIGGMFFASFIWMVIVVLLMGD